MKLLFLVCLLAFSATCFAQVDDKAQSLIALHKKKFDWMTQKKYDSLQFILDDQLLYIHSSGLTETKKEVIENLKTGKLGYTKITLEEAKARLYGDTGVVTGRGLFNGINNGAAFELQLSYTEVYVRIKKQWKLVSRHASRILN